MLPRLHAEEQLARLNAAAYPHMERSDARKYARSLEEDSGIELTVVKTTHAGLEALGITVTT